MIIDTSPDRPRVLGEVDLFAAQVLVHEHAIYIHESSQYYVDRLDWGERKAYVHRIDVDHYTYANRAVTLKPLDVFAEAQATGGRRVHGEVMVASLVTMFKKLKFVTDENVGWGPVDLPELELQTTAYWLTAEGVRGRWRSDDLDVALIGAGRAMQAVAAVLLMVDPRDLGSRRPGAVAAPGGADDLPVRVGAGRRRACPSGCGHVTRSWSPGPPSSSPPVRAKRAVPRAPGRGWNPRSTPRRSRCSLLGELGARVAVAA